MPYKHIVALERDVMRSPIRRRSRYRYRAVCLNCEWVTPWRSTAPAFPDGRERSWLTPRSVIIRVAGEHIRTYTRHVPSNRITGV